MAKMINYGIAYGLSDYGLAERLKIPREEAQKFITDYFAAYEGIRRYTVEMKILARDQGFVSTLLGRRRYLPELTARNGALRSAGERMAINMPIQGTAADGMKIAMVRLDAAMRERGLRSQMLLQVHDELVFETDEAELRDPRDAGEGDHGDGAAARRPPRGRPEGRRELGADGPIPAGRSGAWRRMPKTAGEVARQEAEEEVAAELVS